MTKIINTEEYNIYIDDDISNNLATFINKSKYSQYFVLVDENTKENCLLILKDKINNGNFNLIDIKSGEEHKNINTCSFIWDKLTNLKADRKSLFINLGGGVIGDMGGFTASTYKRGIDFINIPTTLLSQVDASVGGKLGIDFNNLKNQIGLFKNPKSVFICTKLLQTLPYRQILSGFAEIIKHALIYNKKKMEEIYSITDLKNNLNWENIIFESVQIKYKVVKEDPFEKNIRKSLNFGHTIGHAIETFSLINDNKPLLHGESVAIGLICETYLSHLKLNFSKGDLNKISSYILKLFPKYNLEEKNYNQILEYMINDKKNSNEKINFTLLENIGNYKIDNYCDKQEIINSLNYYKNLT